MAEDIHSTLTHHMKPFQLAKYFSLTSLLVIFSSLIVLSLFISTAAKRALLQKSEEYAQLVADNLNHQVFFQFTLPVVLKEGRIQLREERQYSQLDTVVKNTIHGFDIERVVIYDTEGIVTYSTDRKMVGKKNEKLGKNFNNALNGNMASKLISRGGTFLGLELPWLGGERKLITYNPMWVEQPFTWKKGRILGVFEITKDISKDYESIAKFQMIIIAATLGAIVIIFVLLRLIVKRAEIIIEERAREQKELEEQLRHAEQLATLGEMVAGISHEIRNPLGIIRSTAELLEQKIQDPSLKRFPSMIMEEATRLNAILTEFLDFARPKTIQRSECNIEEVLERNISFLEPELKRLHIEVEKQYETNGKVLEADPDLLYRAFLNIFNNALQAMPEGGKLQIRTFIEENGNRNLKILISDSGRGVTEEHLQKIFKPFFTTREKGTGLGLAIVTNIIESHKGKIKIKSQPGEGTTVEITLPMS
ncbi:MAG TPA: GHKL domain-containing protein [Deltaproteobacteria bacterium]|nr:MAG: two-component sensor histidine kinase [Deltaproteobacteria bacterium]HDM78967.1 GHKL domain-containing protein [Deltaproteobacteria bacterium]